MRKNSWCTWAVTNNSEYEHTINSSWCSTHMHHEINAPVCHASRWWLAGCVAYLAASTALYCLPPATQGYMIMHAIPTPFKKSGSSAFGSVRWCSIRAKENNTLLIKYLQLVHVESGCQRPPKIDKASFKKSWPSLLGTPSNIYTSSGQEYCMVSHGSHEIPGSLPSPVTPQWWEYLTHNLRSQNTRCVSSNILLTQSIFPLWDLYEIVGNLFIHQHCTLSHNTNTGCNPLEQESSCWDQMIFLDG